MVGFVDRRDDIMNAAAVIHDRRLAGVYHKQYLPNYGVFDENRYFQAGTETPVFALGEGPAAGAVAGNICADILNPTRPATSQRPAGAQRRPTITAPPH